MQDNDSSMPVSEINRVPYATDERDPETLQRISEPCPKCGSPGRVAEGQGVYWTCGKWYPSVSRTGGQPMTATRGNCDEVAALRAELANMGDAVNVVDHNYREAMTALARADERARRAEAEVERMRSVVEAAIAVIETDKRLYHGSAEHAEAEAEAAFTALDEAVDAFRAAQGETNDA